MGDEVRSELRRLYDEHLARPLPTEEWADLEERFGAPDA